VRLLPVPSSAERRRPIASRAADGDPPSAQTNGRGPSLALAHTAA